MQWELNSERPVYIQLIEQIQNGIISGYYKPGDKLPSIRDLAAEATVNPNTMQKALMELERSELIYTNRTQGKYITSDVNLIKSLKKQSARNLILSFLDNMDQLGFEKEETIMLTTEIVREMGK